MCRDFALLLYDEKGLLKTAILVPLFFSRQKDVQAERAPVSVAPDSIGSGDPQR